MSAPPPAPQPPLTPHPARGGGVWVPETVQERININNGLAQAQIAAFVASEDPALALRVTFRVVVPLSTPSSQPGGRIHCRREQWQRRAVRRSAPPAADWPSPACAVSQRAAPRPPTPPLAALCRGRRPAAGVRAAAAPVPACLRDPRPGAWARRPAAARPAAQTAGQPGWRDSKAFGAAAAAAAAAAGAVRRRGQRVLAVATAAAGHSVPGTSGTAGSQRQHGGPLEPQDLHAKPLPGCQAAELANPTLPRRLVHGGKHGRHQWGGRRLWHSPPLPLNLL